MKMKVAILSHILFILPIFTLIFISSPVLADEIDDLKNQIDKKAKAIQELKQKEGEYQLHAGHAHEQADTLEEVVADFNQQIRDVESDIYIKQQEISATTLKIRQKELEILTHEATIERTKHYIAAALREIYENDGEQVSELIFKYEDFSEFFNQMEYRNLLQEELKAQLEEIRELKQQIEEEKQALGNQRDELEKMKYDLEARNTILDSQRDQKKNLLAQTRNTEWRYKELLKDTREKQAAIQREIFELEDKLRQSIDAASIPAPRPGVLGWPTEGLLTQGYGCTKFAKTSSAYPTCFHNGIDIGARYGTIVVVAHAGRVVAVQNAPYAYGKWIAVEHDNGLTTMYAHLSLQSVVVGQRVNGGEVIGYMGSTGYSTGSHLHFTVYTTNSFSTKPSKIAGTLPIGATINPFNYLP